MLSFVTICIVSGPVLYEECIACNVYMRCTSRALREEPLSAILPVYYSCSLELAARVSASEALDFFMNRCHMIGHPTLPLALIATLGVWTEGHVALMATGHCKSQWLLMLPLLFTRAK